MKADTLLHPVRMRIVQALAAHGPGSAKDLREHLPDIAPATLYRHVKALFEAGFLEVEAEKRVRATVERRYRLVEGATVLQGADLEDVAPAEHLRWFNGFTAVLVDAFARYLGRGEPDLVRDRVRYRLLPLHLSDEEADAFAADLEALCSRYGQLPPGPGRAQRSFAFLTLPEGPTRPR